MNWIEIMIAEAGHADILADMIISENSEWFEVSEVIASRRRLTRLGKYKIREYDANEIKRLFVRREKEKRRKYNLVVEKLTWTPDSDSVLRANWNKLSAFDIGILLNRTDGAIRKRALFLELGHKIFSRSGKLGYYQLRTI